MSECTEPLLPAEDGSCVGPDFWYVPHTGEGTPCVAIDGAQVTFPSWDEVLVAPEFAACGPTCYEALDGSISCTAITVVVPSSEPAPAQLAATGFEWPWLLITLGAAALITGAVLAIRGYTSRRVRKDSPVVTPSEGNPDTQ